MNFTCLDSALVYLRNGISDGFWCGGKPFIHVELGEYDADLDRVTSYGINKDETKPHATEDKEFNHPEMERAIVRVLIVTPLDHERIMGCIRKARQDNDPFDQYHCFSFLPLVGRCMPARKGTWFCSKLVATALSMARDDVYIDATKYDINRMTPHDLFLLIDPISIKGLLGDVRPTIGSVYDGWNNPTDQDELYDEIIRKSD